MKYIYIYIIALLPIMGISQLSHFDQKNAIKISPVEFGKAQFEMSYERYIGDRSSSIIIMPSVYLKEDLRESKEGFQLGAQYRVYLSHIRSDEKSVFLGFHNIGLYAGVYAQYLDYSEDYLYSWWDDEKKENFNETMTKDVNSTEGGAIIGVQLDITKKILIDFYVGGGVRFTDYTDSVTDVVDPNYYYNDVGVFDPEYKGVKPRIGFQLGFMF